MNFIGKFFRADAPTDNDELKSIIDNLNNVLNTKKGFGSFLDSYGIRDMNECSSRAQLEAAIMDEVKNNILNYEPRLEFSSIAAEETDDPFRISFKVECRVKSGKKALFMEFDSVNRDFFVKQT